jgi:hypothetical protein
MATTLNPQILPWVAPICLILVFVLSFFPWVGRYYGGYGVITQSAWGAAFGSSSVDEVYDNKTHWDEETKPEEKPGVSVLMIFFLIVGLLPAVAVGLAAAALPRLKSQFKLPPGLVLAEPWRWLIVTGVTAVALLFLFLQMVTSFSIESRTRDQVAKAAAQGRVGANAIDSKWIDIEEGKELAGSGLRRTFYLRLSFLLLIIAVAGAAATHWLENRGPDRSLPRFEILW